MLPSKIQDSAPPDAPLVAATSGGPFALSPSAKRRLIFFAAFAAFLCLAFWRPLADWVRYALTKDRHSYLLMVPVISCYLVWIKRRELRLNFVSSFGLCLIPIGIGVVPLAFSGGANPLDRLSLQIFSLLNFLLAGCYIFIGSRIMRQIIFPLSFLIFATPVPTLVGDAIEIFLQYTSAEAAYGLLSLTPIPMLRDGLVFQLPGITIRVAQECSGYNSTFVLFMVSTLASYLFLKSPWRRTFLAAAVIPLAILRNGFRIMTIALLCVYVDPKMIDSYIHHHGGPIFFALSLIPFFVLLWWLRKSEIAKSRKQMNPKPDEKH